MRKYLLYSLGIAGIVVMANVAYVKLGLYDSDIRTCNAGLLCQTDSLKRCSAALYFGESSNFTYADGDSSRLSIAELVAQQQPGMELAGISQGAIHASTFRRLIGRLDENSMVNTVIVTMNLRSFGINWIESDLESNLSRAEILYATWPPVVKKLLLTFKAYDDKPLFKRKEVIQSHYKNDKFKLSHQTYTSVREWDKDMFSKGLPDANGNKDEQKTEVACHFIKNYAFVIDEDNPRVKDFDAIVDLCKKKNLKLVFHVLPENYERASELCGQDLTDLMEKNVRFLESRYGKASIFIDNYRLLPDSIFIDRSWPTEHYTFVGRRAVAEEISKAITSGAKETN